MPNVNTSVHTLVRDGFVCQHCGCLLLLAQAVKVLDWHVPGLNLWDRNGRREPLRTRWAVVDHLTSELEGGLDSPDNLAASCISCNSKKGGKTLTITKPRRRPGWDGLAGVFLALSPAYASRMSAVDVKWERSLRRAVAPATSEVCERAAACLRAIASASSVAALDELLITLEPK